jgi:hypothetical protein
MDVRREVNHIFKEFDSYQTKIGEAVIWFKFDLGSSYDAVYDEAHRNYEPGVAVPILWVDQMEDPENYAPEGRRPTQRIRFAISARSVNETGIGAFESHGGRLQDIKPYGKPWWDDRLNDIIYYDGRYYEISDFQIRGRARQDVIIGVAGIETQPMDERAFDFFPRDVQPDYDPNAMLGEDGQPLLAEDGFTPLTQE